MKTKLILIGGVPGTGKTTIAYNLALNLKIDKVLSIDILKALAKTFNTNSEYINTTTHEAYKIENTSIVEGYKRHSKVVNNIVLEVLENIKDKIIIIEGTTINKDFINMLNKDKYDFVSLNLTTSPETLITRYKEKEKIRKSNWIDNIKVIEEIANYLSIDSINIENDNIKNTIERIEKYVKEILYL